MSAAVRRERKGKEAKEKAREGSPDPHRSHSPTSARQSPSPSSVMIPASSPRSSSSYCRSPSGGGDLGERNRNAMQPPSDAHTERAQLVPHNPPQPSSASVDRSSSRFSKFLSIGFFASAGVVILVLLLVWIYVIRSSTHTSSGSVGADVTQVIGIHTQHQPSERSKDEIQQELRESASMPPSSSSVHHSNEPSSSSSSFQTQPYRPEPILFTFEDPTLPSSEYHPLDPHSNIHLYRSENDAIEQHRLSFTRSTGSSDSSSSSSSSSRFVPHLFLRSTPRTRTIQPVLDINPNEESTDDTTQRVNVAIISPAIEVPDPLESVHSTRQFSTLDAYQSIDTNTTSSTPRLMTAVPFIVHVKTPCSSSLKTRLESSLTTFETGYHLDRYLPIGNYLLVPSNTYRDEPSKLMTLLESLKPIVQSWHEYELQDKIEPELRTCFSRKHTHTHQIDTALCRRR